MHSLHHLASLYAFSNLLSVKWANANLGASSPGDYGGYYQWAGTEDVSDTSIILKWNNCPYHIGYDEYSGWTKYNTDSDYGTVDNKTTLEASDDAATVNLGHHSQTFRCSIPPTALRLWAPLTCPRVGTGPGGDSRPHLRHCKK